MTILFPIISGILLGLGFVIPSLSFLVWIALLPLLYVVVKKEPSKKKTFLCGFLSGFIYFGLVLIWYFQALPLDWMGINNKIIGASLMSLGWLISVSFLALFLGFFILSLKYLLKRNWLDILIISSLWIIFEYCRAFGFSILSWGPHSLIGANWTWGSLGYLLSNNQIFLSLSSFGGIYLVGFIIVAVNATLFFLLRDIKDGKSRNIKIGGVVIIVLLITLSYFYKTEDRPKVEKPINVSLIQTGFSSFFSLTNDEKNKRIETKKKITEETAKNFSDIIVLPEDSRLLASLGEQFINETFSNQESLIIDSARTETQDGIKSIINFYDTKNGDLLQQKKLFLMPMGEYLPYIIKIPAFILNKNWVSNFEKSRGYTEGDNISTANFENIKIGGLMCSEIYSPDLYRKIAKDSQIFFNMGSHSFAHGSLILNSQIKSIAQFRAAENSRYLAKTINQGSSYSIDNNGKIIAESPSNKFGILSGDIYPEYKQTTYNKFSDWILLVAIFVILISNTKKLFKKAHFFKSL